MADSDPTTLANDNFSIQLDSTRVQSLSSFKNKLVYLMNSGLLFCLPIYIFTETKGINFWENIHILLGIYLINSLAFALVLQSASLAKLKSLIQSHPRPKDITKAKEPQRKNALENMAILSSISLLNPLFLLIFVVSSGVFFSPLPKLLNYALSVIAPTVFLGFIYRPL